MKFLVVMILFCAWGAFAAIPDSASGWYTPENGFKAEDGEGVVWGYDRDTDEWFEFGKVKVNSNGEITEGLENTDFQGNPAWKTAYDALVKACRNEALLNDHDQAIETLGENLHKVFSTDGITVTGKTPDGSTQSYTIKFTSGIGESGTIQGESDHMKWNLADEKSLEMLKGNKIQIKGWKDADGSSSIFEEDNLGLVARTPGNDLIYRAWYGVDKLSLAPNAKTKKLELKAWSDKQTCGDTLTEILKSKDLSRRAAHHIVTRFGSDIHYLPIGDELLGGGGSPVDGTSITTNTSAGASVQGEASLYGWATADDMGLPYKSNGKLAWKAADEWVDGASLAFADVDGEKKFEVKNAHMYAGKHSKHYFGTGSDKSAPLGWHELPNTSTNRVEGDERTISSNPNIPGKIPDPEVKTLGLIGWNYTYSGQDPLFMVNRGGALDYMPLPAITNLAACACTNKWQSLLGWVEDGELSEDGIKFEYLTLDEYLYNGLGYIYSTTPDNLHFNNDGDKIQASFTAPENWADGLSLNLTDDGKYQIRDFEKAGACGASVSKMLSDPKGSDATTHLLLAKKTDDGSLHYVPFGEGVKSGGIEVDDTTITTNTAHGAVIMGEASIYGWSSAANDTYLSKNEGGNLEWRKIVGGAEVDDTSITTNTAHGAVMGGTASMYGFSTAALGGVPFKSTENKVDWVANSTTGGGLLMLQTDGAPSTVDITAGYGMKVTKQSGSIQIASTLDTPDSAGAFSSITYISNIEYDSETHTLKVTKTTVSAKILNDATAQEETVFVATPHSAEHPAELE